MSSDPNDRELLVRIDQRVENLHGELIGAPGREGRIPKIETQVDKHADQIAFWRGAIAIASFLVLGFGGMLISHLLWGGH